MRVLGVCVVLCVPFVSSVRLGRAAVTPHPTLHAGVLDGSWRRVSYVDRPDGGAPVFAFGRQPIGQFVVTADGYAAVAIMRNPPRPKRRSADSDPDACVERYR